MTLQNLEQHAGVWVQRDWIEASLVVRLVVDRVMVVVL